MKKAASIICLLSLPVTLLSTAVATPVKHPNLGIHLNTPSTTLTETLLIGEQLVICTPNANGAQGSVEILERKTNGVWAHKQTVAPSLGPIERHGIGVAGYQDRLMVAALLGGANSPLVQFYDRTPGGDWSLRETLTEGTGAFTGFGYTMDFSDDGEWLFIGSSYSTRESQAYAGHVSAYRYLGGTYVLQQTMQQQSPSYYGRFGVEIEVEQDRALIFSSGDGTASHYFWNGTQWVFVENVSVTTFSAPYSLTIQDGEALTSWSRSIGGADEFHVTRYELMGQGTSASWQSVQSITGDGFPVDVGLTDDDVLYVTTKELGTKRFSRPGPGLDFGAIAGAKPWADQLNAGATYASDEFIGLSQQPQPGIAVVYGPGIDPIGSPLCFPNAPGASGGSPSLGAYGSIDVNQNDVTFQVAWAAPGQFGYLLASTTEGLSLPANSMGTLCLGGAIGRFKDLTHASSADGEMTFVLDRFNIPTPTQGVIYSHETWFFQVWMRDPQVGSVFTNGVRIHFL